jgi:uncharacterized protein
MAYSQQVLAEALSPRKLELILLPTEKCNFRCTYCYEDFAIGRMSRQLVDSIKLFLKNRIPHIDALTFSWFGGEPLLAKDICIELSDFAHRTCTELGVSFAGGFTTNGYLLDKELFESLLILNQNHFQISLDGDEEWHDKTRVQPNRKPTFARIWNNLLCLRQLDAPFQIVLRLHVHQENIESVKRLYSRIQNEFSADPRFSVFFHRISNLSSKEMVKETVLTNSEYTAALDYIKSSDGLSIKNGNELELGDYICYAAKPNSLLIRANGTIGKCTVALDDDRNNLGKMLPDGTLDISNPKLRQWMLGYMDLEKDTLGCPLHTLPESIDNVVARFPTKIQLRNSAELAD